MKKVWYWMGDPAYEGVGVACSLPPRCIRPLTTSANVRLLREARENVEMARFRAENPKLQQQFADLKRGLSDVSDAEWDSIPEVGNLTRRKRRREERTYVVPDSVLVGDRGKGEYENSLDPMQQDVSSSSRHYWAALFTISCVEGRLCYTS